LQNVQGTPLPSSKVYDSAKKVSYFEQAFAIEAKIGTGCFGNVYRVKSKEDGKLYAVSYACNDFALRTLINIGSITGFKPYFL
jgi:hypothetical protein